MARICVTIDVSCGSGAVETTGLIGTWSVGVLPDGGEPALPPEGKRKKEIKDGKSDSVGTPDAPAGTAHGGGATSQSGTAEPTARGIKKTAEKAGAGNVTINCNSDNSTCTVCFDADHFDWNLTGQFRGSVEIQPAGWAGPGDPPESPKRRKNRRSGGSTPGRGRGGGGGRGSIGGGGGRRLRSVSWPGHPPMGGRSGHPAPYEFFVLRCGVAPDARVRTELSFVFFGAQGRLTRGFKRVNLTVPNVRGVSPFDVMDWLQGRFEYAGVKSFRVSGNAVAVLSDPELAGESLVCVGFSARSDCFPGVASSGSWIAETELFAISGEAEPAPFIQPVREDVAPSLDEPARPETIDEIDVAAPGWQLPMPGATTGVVAADPRVGVTAPNAQVWHLVDVRKAIVPRPIGHDPRVAQSRSNLGAKE